MDVKCSQSLLDAVEAAGGRPVMVATGYPFLLEGMAREKAVAGVELAGHYYFDDPIFDFDDGVFASARIAGLLSEHDGTVSAVFAGLPGAVSTSEIRVPCADEMKFEVPARIAESLSARHEVNTTDGARVRFDSGWGLVRASNTQPTLVLVFEARSEEALEEIQDLFRAELRRLGVEPTF
jgi:phosphomannomutase/phosphoglucomutase